jgi:1,4-dihydroxy-2-naphthoyl-CoA synthase
VVGQQVLLGNNSLNMTEEAKEGKTHFREKKKRLGTRKSGYG